MIRIEGVRCPICKERLTGTDSGELSMNLKSHMADIHQMREITPSMGPSVRTTERGSTMYRSSAEGSSRYDEGAVESWRDPSRMRSPAEQPVTTFSSRDPSMESESSRTKTEEVRQWRYPQTEPSGERGPARGSMEHGGGAMHRFTHRYDEMRLSMSCPVCGNTIYGSDDDDLTDELRFHFKDAHRDAMRR